MKKERNELLMFLAGLAMLIVGLFILSQKVMVYTSWWGIGRFHMTGSLIFVPLIAGIIWLFATGSRGSKILTGLGVAFIVVFVILSVDIHLMTMTLFDWIILLVLIFGGIGLLARVLFANGPANPDGPSKKDDMEKRAMTVDEELERMKNNK